MHPIRQHQSVPSMLRGQQTQLPSQVLGWTSSPELCGRVDRADGLQTELPGQGHGMGSPGQGGWWGGISLYLGCSSGRHWPGWQGPRICSTHAGRGAVPLFAARAWVEGEDQQKHLSVPPGSCDQGNILGVVSPESPWPLAVGGRGQIQPRTHKGSGGAFVWCWRREEWD